MKIGEILNKLEKPKKLSSGGYNTLCPGHADKERSLTVTEQEGKILIHCHAGCKTEAILEKLGLQMTDLFTDSKPEPKTTIIATYDYKDEKHNLLFQVVRYVPKSFRQRHKNSSGEWVWNLDGVRRVPYHLPDFMVFDKVYLVEGEKDADTLWNWLQPATTTAGGASNWKPEYAEYFTDKDVVIIPDKDAAGYAYARTAATSLEGKAKSVSVIILPGDKVKDTTDWFEQGGFYEELLTLEQPVSVLFEQDKPNYQLHNDGVFWVKPVKDKSLSFKGEKISEERTGIHARITITLDYEILGWSYFNVERSEDRVRLSNSAHQTIQGDFAKEFTKENMRTHLDNFCAGLWDAHNDLYKPERLAGSETIEPLKFLLYPYITEGGGTILFAPPGRGKSYTGLLWAISIDSGINTHWTVNQANVLFINLERSRESLRRRVSAINKILGLPATRPLLTLNARGQSLSKVLAACRKSVIENRVKVVVLDSMSRAGLGDLNENKPVNSIIDALSSICDTWVALGHTSRASEEHVYGSIMFDAGADIVIQLNSETKDDGTLGVGYNITKKNDIPTMKQETWAFKFNDFGLYEISKAKPYEFSNIEATIKQSMENAVKDFILNQDSADATATEIANDTGYARVNISKYLNQSGQFIQTRKVKASVYYAVKEDRQEFIP